MPFLSAIQFNWYGFLIGAGMAICLISAYFTSRKRGINGDLILDIALICIPLALIGARVYYVIFDAIAGGYWDFARFFGFYDGKFEGFAGLAIYGGLIGAVIGAVIIVAVRRNKPDELKITFMQLLDMGFTFILLGQAIGRWGNFANKEAHGTLITDPALQWFPFGVEIGGKWYLATFFYESFWNVIGFGMLLYLYIGKRKSFDGFIFSCYCIWYGIGRAWIEGLRTDSLWLIPNVIRVSQLLSVILVFLGLGIIGYHIYKAKKSNKKIFIFAPENQLSDEYYGYDTSKLNRPMKGSLLYKEPAVAVASNGDSGTNVEAKTTASDDPLDEKKATATIDTPLKYAEEVKTEEVKSEEKTEEIKAEEVKSEVKTEEVKPEEVKPEEKTEEIKTEEIKTEEIKSEEKTEEVKPEEELAATSKPKTTGASKTTATSKPKTTGASKTTATSKPKTTGASKTVATKTKSNAKKK